MKDNTFTAHGIYTISNAGGYEIELADSGDAARIRFPDESVSDWLEIEYNDEGEPIIDKDGLDVPLNMVMKHDMPWPTYKIK